MISSHHADLSISSARRASCCSGVRKGRMEERASDSAGAGEVAESVTGESVVEAEGDLVGAGGAVDVVGSEEEGEEPVVGEETVPAVAIPGTQ
jgi:hypothetical protein